MRGYVSETDWWYARSVLELGQAFGFYTLSSVFIPMKLYIDIIESDK